MERLPTRPMVEPYRKIAEKAGNYFSQRVVNNRDGTLATAGFFRRIALFFSELRDTREAYSRNQQVKKDFLTAIKKSYTPEAATEAEKTISGIKRKSLRAKHVRYILSQADLTDGAAAVTKSAIGQVQPPENTAKQDNTSSEPESSAPEKTPCPTDDETDISSPEGHDLTDDTSLRQPLTPDQTEQQLQSVTPDQTEQQLQSVTPDQVDSGQNQEKDSISSDTQETDQSHGGKSNPNWLSDKKYTSLYTVEHYKIDSKVLTDGLTNNHSNQQQVGPDKNPAANENTDDNKIDSPPATTEEYHNLD